MASTSWVPPTLTVVEIPCCLCGTMIRPNAANQCSTCLAQQIHLQDVMQRGPGGREDIIIHQCRDCRRYARTEKHYQRAEPESPELLALCLKHIPALHQNHHSSAAGWSSKIHLVDAKWIWTEPHSMRLKLHLTVRTEVQQVLVQQRVPVEVMVQWKHCPECHREYTHRTWHAIVQVRQKRSSSSNNTSSSAQSESSSSSSSSLTLAALERALAKHPQIRKHVLRLDTVKQGWDFYFMALAQAQAFVTFLQKVVPLRTSLSKQVVSNHVHNHTTHTKYTLTAELLPLCRHDLIWIHKSCPGHRLAGRLALVMWVQGTALHLVDASPTRQPLLLPVSSGTGPGSQLGTGLESFQAEISPETYYKYEKYYHVLQSAQRWVRFVVMDVELCQPDSQPGDADDDTSPLYRGPHSGRSKYALADVQVVREADFGRDHQQIYHGVTHLGHLIAPGDVVLGYDLVAMADRLPDENVLQSNYVLPDVVLVKRLWSAEEVATMNDPKLSAEMNPSPSQGRQARRTTKKRERRRLRKQGKKKMELADTAVRMGFFPAEDDEDVNFTGDAGGEDDFANPHQDDQQHLDQQSIESNFDQELVNDPQLAAELEALERELEALGMPSETGPEEEDGDDGDELNAMEPTPGPLTLTESSHE